MLKTENRSLPKKREAQKKLGASNVTHNNYKGEAERRIL
jgi:hypothetical protein